MVGSWSFVHICSHLPPKGTGVLPANISMIPSLSLLNIAGNSFSGTLPPSWSVLIGAKTLTLSNNAIFGSLPPAWSHLVGLQV